MQDEREHCRVELALRNRQAFQFALPKIDVARSLETVPRSVEHVRGAVDGNHLSHVWRDDFRQLPCSASEIADHERRVDQAEHAPEVKRIAEEITTESIPIAGGRREELFRFGPAARQNAAQPS